MREAGPGGDDPRRTGGRPREPSSRGHREASFGWEAATLTRVSPADLPPMGQQCHSPFTSSQPPAAPTELVQRLPDHRPGLDHQQPLVASATLPPPPPPNNLPSSPEPLLTQPLLGQSQLTQSLLAPPPPSSTSPKLPPFSCSSLMFESKNSSIAGEKSDLMSNLGRERMTYGDITHLEKPEPEGIPTLHLECLLHL